MAYQRQQDAEHARVMAPYTAEIYGQVFPGVEILTVEEAFSESIQARGLGTAASQIAEMLDRDFAIDKVLRLPSGATFTVQEKVRRHRYLEYGDFTQEFMNGVGTDYEDRGEWFKLSPQLYFYGWSNQANDGLSEWAIINVVKYKLLVEEAGGLDLIGTLQQNRTHGSANFYAIPIASLEPAFIDSSQGLKTQST